MREQLANVVLVLDRPEDVVNVAAVVRVMNNFGLQRLRLVEPAAWDPHRVEGIAHRAGAVVSGVQHFPTLADALADCGLVLGTTARPRAVTRPRLLPETAALTLLAAAANPGTPAALLFGPERSGLANAALDHCHALVTIPTDGKNSSLNLAQAALVLAYELWLAATGSSSLPTTSFQAQLASELDRQPMFDALAEMLRALYPNSADARMSGALSRLQALLLRAGPSPAETAMLTGLFSHLTRLARPR